MTPSVLSQVFSWIAIAGSVVAAISTGLALHYRTAAGRLQNAEINRLKPRSISDQQKEAIRVQLLERRGRSVGFIYRLMDGESGDYAKQIADVFASAEWMVLSNAGNSLNDFTGYIVGAVSDEKLVQDLQFVRDALNNAGVDCRFSDIRPDSLGGALTSDRIWLIVGRKP